MRSVWVVTQQSMDDHFTWAVAAFSTKDAAKQFQSDHQQWLDRMQINEGTDCYQVPIDPEYTDEGYVMVKQYYGDDSLTVIPLNHVGVNWIYSSQPNEVVQEGRYKWVIVKAVDCQDAEHKAIKLFDEYNQ